MCQLELTLAIIKPHALKVPYVLKKVRNIILSNGFYIVRSKRVIISTNDVELFYEEHKDKFFYNRLITFMQSGHSDLHILAHENAITKWRTLMGPTKVFKAQFTHPTTIRGTYGLTDTRNVTHGSDSVESTKKEINILFPEFNYHMWYENEMEYYQSGNISFDNEKFVHIPQQTNARPKTLFTMNN